MKRVILHFLATISSFFGTVFLFWVLSLIAIHMLLGCGKKGDNERTEEPAKTERGEVGPPGKSGRDGKNGVDGQSCSVTSVEPDSNVAPNGGSLISCPTSSSLILNGSNGSNGTSGTIVTSIPLCSGVPTYPSKFIEVAFCIDNELYAVYSANGGFMTYLPEGAYSSNGIGSACNFTVLPNCEIQ